MSAALLGAARNAPAQQRAPNIVFILADDLGYGDLGCYGSRVRTPNIDRIAAEGIRFTDFYSASALCSPSRAALLTGRYPARVGMTSVLQASDKGGLSLSETTMAQTLRRAGYRTACIGKWHLGATLEYLPTNRGFDEFFGIPYSHDMWPLPLLRNTQVLEADTNPNNLTSRFTDEAVSFINRSQQSPFFLYLAHCAPHIPLAMSDRFKSHSQVGPYGDVVEELDWGVGQVLQAIQDAGVDNQTLVMFSSDNGPWYQGSPGRLRGRKGETYEGGMRVPLLARFPGNIAPGGQTGAVATTMDILPTLARLAGAPLPAKLLDGIDIWPVLSGAAEQVDRDLFLFFDSCNLQCARLRQWKIHFARPNHPAWSPDPAEGSYNLPLPSPELYNLALDPEEGYECSRDHPEIITEVRARIDRLLQSFPDVVRNSWRDTMSRQVEYTPVGALPVLKKP